MAKIVIQSIKEEPKIQYDFDSSGSSTEFNDTEDIKYVDKSLEERKVNELTDTVTFTQLHKNKKKEYCEKCRFCSEVFTNPVELLRHKRTHSKEIDLPLEIIENYFDFPNRSVCPICKEKLKTRNFKSVFVKHLLTHTTSFKYTCTVCKQKFKRKDHRNFHQKRHVVPLDMEYFN